MCNWLEFKKMLMFLFVFGVYSPEGISMISRQIPWNSIQIHDFVHQLWMIYPIYPMTYPIKPYDVRPPSDVNVGLDSPQ